MAYIGFNASTVEPASNYDALKPGKYLAMVIDSTVKPTKNGSGEYLQLTFEVIEGNGKGRKIFERLNFKNSNKVAEEIAQKQLSALCHAVGVIDLQDSETLHNLPVTLEITVEEGSNGYGPQNRIKSYTPANGGGRAQAPVNAPAPAPAQSSTPAWKRRAA